MVVESSKGEAWAGQHEINFRLRRTRCATADDHVVYKTGAQGDRAPARVLGHLHGEAAPRLGRLLVPHPLLALARRRERVRRRVGPLPALPRRADRLPRRPRDLRRADDQLVQALRGRELGADDARLGLRQPHVRLPRRRPRLRAAARDAHPRRRREPVPRVRGAARGRAVRDRGEARARAGVRGERVRVGRGAVPARAARGDRPARVERRRARGCSATRWSTTTSTTRAPSRSCSTRPSPATSASGCSNVARPSR